MREYIEGVITPEEASNLSNTVGYLDFTDARLGGVLDIIRGFADVRLWKPSYVRVEENRLGHPWHIDQGNTGHMTWCDYSASVLLSHPSKFDGGGFYFFGDEEPTYHYCDLLLYDSHPSNKHCVKRNSGGRKVLLMFFSSL